MFLEDIPELDINNSGILKLMEEGSKHPTVFLPNYGEFGSTIHKLIKMVYFYDCPEKIICCKKGEEAYYPNASGFCYDWQDFVEERHKWGFFTKKKLAGSEKYKEYQKLFNKDFSNIKQIFGEKYNYIQLWMFNIDHIFNKHSHRFVFDLLPKIKNNIYADVIISPRDRKSREENNFQRWEKIIKELNCNGYSVGCVGSKNQSMRIENSSVNSWDYEDNANAVIELLSNCKLYLGLDTGVSHLASFMSVPMIVFSHSNQKHYFTYFMRDINKNYFLDLGKNAKNDDIIVESVLKFLS